MTTDPDRRWLERAGYLVEVEEVETGIYSVTLVHQKNPALRFPDTARGVSEHLAIAHAREHLEEALAARPPRSRHDTCQSRSLRPATQEATRVGSGAPCLSARTRSPKRPWAMTAIAIFGGKRRPSPSGWEQHPIGLSRHLMTPSTAASTQRSSGSRFQRASSVNTASSYARGRPSTERALHRPCCEIPRLRLLPCGTPNPV